MIDLIINIKDFPFFKKNWKVYFIEKDALYFRLELLFIYATLFFSIVYVIYKLLYSQFQLHIILLISNFIKYYFIYLVFYTFGGFTILIVNKIKN